MNNQPSPEEQRNLILAGILSLGVVMLWQVLFFEPNLEKQRAAEQARQEQAAKTEQALASGQGNSPFQGKALNREEALKESPRISIETPSLRGSIALKGGQIDELLLRKHREELDQNSPDVELLWPQRTQQAYFASFGWNSEGGATATPDSSALWAVAPGSPKDLRPGQPVTLRWENGEGLVFLREIAVDERYMFTVTQRVENRASAPVSLRSQAAIRRFGTPQSTGIWILHEGPIGVVDGSLKEVDYSDLEEDPTIRGAASARGRYYEVAQQGWLGFTDKYWMTALAPAKGQAFTGVFSLQSGPRGQPEYQTRIIYPQQKLAPKETIAVTTRFFAGAKEMGALRDYQYLLDGIEEPQGFFGKLTDFFFYGGESRFTDAIDWGWFAFLTRPIFEILAGLNAWVGNMGVAIILLTLMFKLLLFPLANKAYASMSKMKKVQPEMQKLQERFKDDRQAMQQELMALYKREQVNPAAGCVPILLQIPIFFSLYKVLFVTLEIRHAPFFGWIQDLSAPDPTSILNLFGLMPWGTGADGILFFLAIGVWPILMGLTMWIQQMLNPAPTDPVQAQVFALMPLLFMFMLGHFASGLVIYWTANNLFTIAQQYTIMRGQGVEVDIIGNMKQQLGLGPKETGS